MSKELNQTVLSTAPKPKSRNRWFDLFPTLVDGLGELLDRILGPKYTLLMLSLLGGAMIALLQVLQTGAPQLELTEGMVAPRDLRVTSDLLIEDPTATENARQAARINVAPIYDLDPEIPFLTRDRLLQMFAYLASVEKGEKNSVVVGALVEQFGMTYDDSFVGTLRALAQDENIDTKLKILIDKLYQLWIIPDRERLRSVHSKGIEVRVLGQEEGQRRSIKPKAYDRILGMNEARKYLQSEARALLRDTQAWTRLQLVRAASEAVRPNLTFNQMQSEREAQLAADSVKPVLVQFTKGEIIAREGDRISVDQAHRIQLLKAGFEQKSTWRLATGTGMFCSLIFGLLFLAGMQSGWRRPSRSTDFLFLVSTMWLVVGLFALSTPIIEGVQRGFPWLTTEILFLAFPVAIPAMLARAVYLPRYAVYIGLSVSALAGYLMGNPWLLFVYASGSVVIALRLNQIRRRSAFFAIGLQAGLMQGVMAVALFLVRETQDANVLLAVGGLAILGGFASGFVAMFLLPIYEWAFNFTTDAALSELAEDDQPLLRWLHIRAPGTYNHSVNVGRLGELAAESIGADALLTKVGAYYHDIGKGLMPEYFVENQQGFNPHEGLKPSMSALTIISHVTKGAELGKEHRLPTPLLDFIRQHHGTNLVEYFYAKAQEAAEKSDIDQPLESAYRYPGPKPQTKESGILMLADAVEATSRVLAKPNEANIRGMVHRLINKAFVDGQLDECPLTLKDLDAIARSFSMILTGMMHARIAYPSNITGKPKPTKEEKTPNVKDSPDKSKRKDRGSDNDDDDPNDRRDGLKRVGIS